MDPKMPLVSHEPNPRWDQLPGSGDLGGLAHEEALGRELRVGIRQMGRLENMLHMTRRSATSDRCDRGMATHGILESCEESSCHR